MKPLNGVKTHPLSLAARLALAIVDRFPVPRQEINPGIVNRLLREELVEVVQLPSPYKTVLGRVSFLKITAAGRKLAEKH